MREQSFRHEALFYRSDEDFLAGTLPFIREGVAQGEQVMVAVTRPKIELLGSRLNGGAGSVTFADMQQLGRNPALIIAAWQDFVAANARDGRSVRGIGEPTWPERRPAEVVECHHHESLVNVAFRDGPPWWLLCPYDARHLDRAVLARAEHNHHLIEEGGLERESDGYVDATETDAPFTGPLADPPVDADELRFGSPEDLAEIRDFLTDHPAAQRLEDVRVDGLVLAVDEVATNTLRHGAGAGTLRVWGESDGMVCEVSDRGAGIDDPLVGRIRPSLEQPDGRGLWIANNSCDLVQIRSSPAGTVVRCHLGPSERGGGGYGEPPVRSLAAQ